MNTTTLINREYLPVLTDLVLRSKQTISLTMYQVGFKKKQNHSAIEMLCQQLQHAALRGVKCRAILAAGSAYMPSANAANLARDIFIDWGWEVIQMPDTQLMHAKSVVFDKEQLLIGSHNWTLPGLMINYETSVLVEDKHQAENLHLWHDLIAAKKRP